MIRKKANPPAAVIAVIAPVAAPATKNKKSGGSFDPPLWFYIKKGDVLWLL